MRDRTRIHQAALSSPLRELAFETLAEVGLAEVAMNFVGVVVLEASYALIEPVLVPA